LRISATGISILSLFTPARRSCSRCRSRRSLSWRISSRMYSLGGAPVTGVDLALDVVFESFGKRNVQGSHGHTFIIWHFMSARKSQPANMFSLESPALVDESLRHRSQPWPSFLRVGPSFRSAKCEGGVREFSESRLFLGRFLH
jgi:hypothetical protein